MTRGPASSPSVGNMRQSAPEKETPACSRTGDGSYTLDEVLSDDRGTIESSLTGLYPYASVHLNDRVGEVLPGPLTPEL